MRKRIRSTLTVGGVGIAVAVLVSLAGFDNGYQRSLSSNIDKMGYQLLVTAKGCPYEAATMMLKGGGGLRYIDQGIYEKIKDDDRIHMITPQLVSTVFDPDRSEGQGGFAMFMGITDSYLDLKPWSQFKSGKWFSSDHAEEVIMGYEAAEVEQRLVGDQIYLPGIDKVLSVMGIFERNGTQDDGIIFMPLKTSQTIFELPDKLTGVGIKLKDIQEINQFEEDLYMEPGIQVVSMTQVRGTILNLVSSAKVMANSIGIIAVFIAVIGVVNTILMAVFERTREIGVMKAIGASRIAVFRLIWTETVLICTIGGVLGCLLAVIGSDLVESIIKGMLPYAPDGKIVLIVPELLSVAFAGAIITGIIAGVYPAWRASSMRPVEAIRTGE
jgi:putative ABC transport system permease protein